MEHSSGALMWVAGHLELIELAVAHGAQFIAFPELSLTGYEPRLARELEISLNATALAPAPRCSERSDAEALGQPRASYFALLRGRKETYRPLTRMGLIGVGPRLGLWPERPDGRRPNYAIDRSLLRFDRYADPNAKFWTIGTWA
jgi:hypothetical protein